MTNEMPAGKNKNLNVERAGAGTVGTNVITPAGSRLFFISGVGMKWERSEIMFLRWQRNFLLFVAVVFLALAVHQCNRANEERIVKEELEQVLVNQWRTIE